MAKFKFDWDGLKEKVKEEDKKKGARGGRKGAPTAVKKAPTVTVKKTPGKGK